MSEINLEDARINFEGEWLSAEDLANRIQEKMKAGDMKLTNIAAALEELNNALENSHRLEVAVVISKQEYEQLKKIGGENDCECIRKAIKAYIGGEKAVAETAVKNKKKLVIKCPKCKAPIEIASDERPLDVECSKCGTGGRLTPQNKWVKLE